MNDSAVEVLSAAQTQQLNDVQCIQARLLAHFRRNVEHQFAFPLHNDADPHAFYHQRAAVLIPLIARDNEISVLLTKRSEQLSSHSGEVAFPGGKCDAGESALACALRESFEEIGLRTCEVIGQLNLFVSKRGVVVAPFVALVDLAHFEPRINASEVAALFVVPLRVFLGQAEFTATRLFQVLHRVRPIAPADAPPQEFRIWGLTAFIMMRFLAVVVPSALPAQVHASMNALMADVKEKAKRKALARSAKL